MILHETNVTVWTDVLASVEAHAMIWNRTLTAELYGYCNEHYAYGNM